jgi:pilus assembly protein TadC
MSIQRAMGSAGTAEKKVLPFTVFKKKCLGFLDFSLWTATSGGVNPRAMGAAGTARLRRIILFSYYSFIPTDI